MPGFFSIYDAIFPLEFSAESNSPLSAVEQTQPTSGSSLFARVASIYYAGMPDADHPNRRKFERMSRAQLREHQRNRLNRLIEIVLPDNAHYASKFAGHDVNIHSLDDLAKLPFTTKADLVAADREHGNRTFPASEYVRFHRTSGTSGNPLAILDTADDWAAWIDSWQYVLDSADITTDDIAVMAFSFGPFIGFWSANDAIAHRGAMVVPAGGMSTRARLELINDSHATVICCTPTYAMRMAAVARESGVQLTDNDVSRIIVAGEPGGSIPAIRERIESAWGATVIDHSGATEVGPWGYTNAARTGLHVIERDFIAEFIDQDSLQPIDPGSNPQEPCELVLTSLARTGMPAIRYRTGDLTIPRFEENGNNFVLLDGGVLGRADDMVIVRGVNVFPSSIEAILRDCADIGEFQITASKNGEMDELAVHVEAISPKRCEEIGELFQSRLGLRVAIDPVEAGTLPRFEAKSKRFVDNR